MKKAWTNPSVDHCVEVGTIHPFTLAAIVELPQARRYFSWSFGHEVDLGCRCGGSVVCSIEEEPDFQGDGLFVLATWSLSALRHRSPRSRKRSTRKRRG